MHMRGGVVTRVRLGLDKDPSCTLTSKKLTRVPWGLPHRAMVGWQQYFLRSHSPCFALPDPRA